MDNKLLTFNLQSGEKACSFRQPGTYQIKNERDEDKNKSSISKGTVLTADGVEYQRFHYAAKQLVISPQTVLNRCKSDNFPTWSIRG